MNENKMSKPKSKRLALEDRIEILRRLEHGEPACSLASYYRVTPSAITQIKQNKENLLERKKMIDEAGGNAAKKKRWTGIEESPLERVLYQWYVQKRAMGKPVSGPLLQEKALFFNHLLSGPSTFKASEGFLHRFKKRHSISCSSVRWEKLSADSETSDTFRQEISNYVREKEYSLDNIYNADETGLYWKMLPNKTLVMESEVNVDEREASKEREVSKERVTLMICANASGTHKIPLLVIGKDAEPNCLKNVPTLPFVYKSPKSAWMDRRLMQEWYVEVFLPEIERFHAATGKKSLLILDNAPSHPPVDEFDSLSDTCEVKFLPRNVTSLIQPMNQGIIDKVKKVYKKNLLRLVLTEETSEGVETLLKSLSVSDCCYSLASAWDEVTLGDIRNAWKNLLPINVDPVPADCGLQADIFHDYARRLPHQSDLTLNNTNHWLNIDVNDPGWRVIEDEEFVTGIEPDQLEQVFIAEPELVDMVELEEDHDDKSHLQNLQHPEANDAPKDALHGLECVLGWYQTQPECTMQYIKMLNDLKSLAVEKIIRNEK